MREKVKNIERPDLIIFERIRERERLDGEKIKVLYRLDSIKQEENINDLMICTGVISGCVGTVNLAEFGTFTSILVSLFGGSVAVLGFIKNKKLSKENETLLMKLNEIDDQLSAFTNRDINAIDLIELDEDAAHVVSEKVMVRKR